MADATGTLGTQQQVKDTDSTPLSKPPSAAPAPSTKTGPTPDAADPNGSIAAASRQNQNETPAAAAAMAAQLEDQDVDDFGLPVRKFVQVDTPATPSTDPDAATPQDQPSAAKRKWSVSLRTRNLSRSLTGGDPSTPGRSRSSSPVVSATEEKLPKQKVMPSKSGAGADSDSDEDFKDAMSNPVSESATPQNGPLTPVRQKAVSGADPSQTAADEAPQPGAAAQSGGLTNPNDRANTEAGGHGHGASVNSVGGGEPARVSEFSHQLLSTKKEEKEEEDDGGWQTMPSYAPYDIFDDDNKLIAREFDENADEEQKVGYAGLGGAGKGYTRVVLDDDADSVTSMDENTHYLFKNAGGTTSMVDEDQEARDAVSQLQATKDLLTEGQRIAYVGLTRLELSGMTREFEEMEQNRKTKKEIRLASEAMKMWAQKMMIRLYAHMEISAAEQVMIEQLSDHGVIPADLTPVLMANARVKNPMAAESTAADAAGAKEDKGEGSEKASGRGKSLDLTSRSSLESGSGTTTSLSPTKSEVRTVADPVKEDEEEVAAPPPPPYEAHPDKEMPGVKTPTQLPGSQKIDIDLRWTVLCDLFLMLIADSIYDARSRHLLERVGKSLEIDWLDICRFEKRVTDALEMQQNAEKENWNEEEHMETRRKLALRRRYVMMGLATVGGGLVIGLSAGLLAPVIGGGLAAGFTTIGIAGTNSFLGGTAAAAIITSGAAASGGVIGGRAANRRTGSVRTFEYRPLHNNKRVNLIVTVSGWMTGKVDDVRLPFSTVDSVMGDIYSVLWEPEMLRSMGDTINLLATEALTQGLQQLLGSTILIPLMAALQLPVILTKLAYLIDNPWSVSLDRATAAGLILADSLIDRNLGTRPVTLVGYSLGSRVIFSCLMELARKGALGIVQNAYLFGTPVVFKPEEYTRARTVVAGRFVNGYSSSDWILGYLFRLTGGGIRRVAGLAPVQGIPRLENLDVTSIVQGHMDYRAKMPRLLRECGWLVESDEFTEIEDADPENHAARQRELINEIEEARKELDKEVKAERGGGFFSFARKKKALKRKEWEIYEDAAKQQAAAASSGGSGGGKTEDKEGNNHGVLFDVDAIRAELAKDSKREQENPEDFMLQIKELESTLPPMRLDVSPAPTPPAALAYRPSWESNDFTKSVSSNSLKEPFGGTGELATTPSPATHRTSFEYRLSAESGRTPNRTPNRTPTLPAQQAMSASDYHQHRRSSSYQVPQYHHHHNHHLHGDSIDDGIQMTFDTSFHDDDRHMPSSSHSSPPPPPPPPPKGPGGGTSISSSSSLSAMNNTASTSSSTANNSGRPGMKTSQTVPNITLADPWADLDDDDDPDFGKEREISMTFA